MGKKGYLETNCEAEDCYYEGDTNRLIGYNPKINELSCVCNDTWVDELGSDLDGKEAPFEFVVCDVDFQNTDMTIYGTCAECDRSMIDEGVCVASKNYCRLCLNLKKITELVSGELGMTPEKFKEEYPDITWADWSKRRNMKLHRNLARAMWKQQQAKSAADAKIKARKRKRKREIATEIKKMVPELDLETAEQVAKRYKMLKPPKNVAEIITRMLNMGSE